MIRGRTILKASLNRIGLMNELLSSMLYCLYPNYAIKMRVADRKLLLFYGHLVNLI